MDDEMHRLLAAAHYVTSAWFWACCDGRYDREIRALDDYIQITDGITALADLVHPYLNEHGSLDHLKASPA